MPPRYRNGCRCSVGRRRARMRLGPPAVMIERALGRVTEPRVAIPPLEGNLADIVVNRAIPIAERRAVRANFIVARPDRPATRRGMSFRPPPPGTGLDAPSCSGAFPNQTAAAWTAATTAGLGSDSARRYMKIAALSPDACDGIS